MDSREINFDIIPFQVDLRHKDETKDLPVVEIGIDLTEFYQSVEWDILSVPAQRYVNDTAMQSSVRFQNFPALTFLHWRIGI